MLTRDRDETRLPGILSLTTLVLTAIWLALLVAGIVRDGPVETLDQALAVASRMDALFTLTYLNAALITVVATAFFAALTARYRDVAPVWSIVALSFVPPYTTLNLIAYLSQVAIVPRLLALGQASADPAATAILLAQMLQQWPGSLVSVLNNLAYAVLGVPSVIFGVLLYRETRAGGALLALNGVACAVGFAGIIADSAALSLGSVAGGVLFLCALIPVTRQLWRGHV